MKTGIRYTLSAEQLEQLLAAVIEEYHELLANGICDAEARQLAVQQIHDNSRPMADVFVGSDPTGAGSKPQRDADTR